MVDNPSTMVAELLLLFSIGPDFDFVSNTENFNNTRISENEAFFVSGKPNQNQQRKILKICVAPLCVFCIAIAKSPFFLKQPVMVNNRQVFSTPGFHLRTTLRITSFVMPLL